MPKQSFSNLDSRGQAVQGELTQAANTAERIGKLIRDIIASMPTDFDSSVPYDPGQWVIWNGRLVRCFITTLAGESPASKAEKWVDFVANAIEKIDGTQVQDLPVTVKGLVAYVAREIKKVNGNGNYTGPDKATAQQIDEAKNDTTYVTPYLLGLVTSSLAQAIAESQNNLGSQTLQQVTDKGAVTNKVITTGGYKRSKQNPFSGQFSLAIWNEEGVLESLEKATLAQLKAALDPSSQTLTFQFKTNECVLVGGVLFNPNDYKTPASAKLYINNTFISTVTATAANAPIAANYGLPASTVLMWSAAIPENYRTKGINRIEVRNPSTGDVLGAVDSPGNCNLATTPQPTFRIVRHMIELPSTPGVNPAPVLVNRIPDQPITDLGEYVVTPPQNEYSDPGDKLTMNMTGYNAGAVAGFPSGVSYDAKLDRLVIAGSVPSGTEFVVWRTCVDSGGQKGEAYFFKVTVKRGGAYVKDIGLKGTIRMSEAGAEGTWYVEETMSDDNKRVYTGGGTPNWVGGYPNGAFVYGFNSPDPGVWHAKIPADSLENDVTLKMGFTLPGANGRLLMLDVAAVNSVCQRPAGLGTYNLIWNFKSPAGALKTFSSLADANATMGAHYDNTAYGTPSSFAVNAASFTIGQKVYNGVSPDCSLVSDNIYYVIANNGTNTVKKAIRTKDGIIVEVLDSTYTTPVTPANGCSVLEEVAYIINAKGTGNQVDSVGFLYKGTGVSYRFSIQSTYDLSMELYNALTNDATVTLTGNIARFNHRIVQAMASRVWRGDMPYKVRLEIYATGQPQTAPNLLKAVEFGVDMNQAIGVPITGFLCQN